MQLVDTNVISELIRTKPDAGVIQWRNSFQTARANFVLSVITIDEIAFGISRRPTPRLINWFDSFSSLHQILPITETIARRAGEMRAQLEQNGHKRTQADMLLAATAQVHGLTLVTRNVADFNGCGIALLNPFAK